MDCLAPPHVLPRPKEIPLSHGEVIQDDYYWLRDDSRQSVEILEHLARENEYIDRLIDLTDMKRYQVT